MYSSLDILVESGDGRESQRALLQRVAEEQDDRDWRAHAAYAPSGDAAPAPKQGGGRGGRGGAASGNGASGAGSSQSPAPGQLSQTALGTAPPSATSNIQRASDLGRTAWAPAAHGAADSAGSTEVTMRTIKGILNKLTPEKFERLLAQIVPLLSSYEVVAATIERVFEAAVAQPTFVAMYAELCSELDAVLPELEDPQTGERATFKKLLANQCQREYEAAGDARAAAAKSPAGPERDEAERAARNRTLGTIRLVGELFKKSVINDRIVLVVLRDLLEGRAPGGKASPSPEAVEAVCEMLTTAGAALERSERGKPRLDAAFATLQSVAADRAYPSRVRFIARDVIELRAQRWVPRREAFTAKKLDEVHAEAAAELGIDVAIPGLDGPGAASRVAGGLGVLRPLPGLGGVAGAAGRPGAAGASDLELFPAFRSDDAGWAAARAKRSSGASAFLGDVVEIPDAKPQAEGDEAAAAAAAAGTSTSQAADAGAAASTSGAASTSAVQPRTDLSDEQRESLARSVYSDYVAEGKPDEAERAARELCVPGFGAKLLDVGLKRAYDALDKKEVAAVRALLGELVRRGVVPPAEVDEALAQAAEAISDDAVDYLGAPAILAGLFADALEAGALDLARELDVFATVADGMVKRDLFALFAKAVGPETLSKKTIQDAGKNLEEILKADPEFDGDLPSVDEFLAEAKLQNLL